MNKLRALFWGKVFSLLGGLAHSYAYSLNLIVWIFIDRPRFHQAVRTSQIPRCWIEKARRFSDDDPETSLGSRSGFMQFCKKSNRPEGIFVYNGERLLARFEIVRSPVIYKLENELGFLAAYPEPALAPKSIVCLQAIRRDYQMLLNRAVGGVQYEDVWKRALMVLDQLIEELGKMQRPQEAVRNGAN